MNIVDLTKDHATDGSTNNLICSMGTLLNSLLTESKILVDKKKNKVVTVVCR